MTAVLSLDPRTVRPGSSWRATAPEDPVEWKGFVETVRVLGVLEPILVRRDADGYVCLAGHRRRLACEQLGIPVPAIAHEGGELLAVVENTQRRALRPADLADALAACRPHYPSAAALARGVGLSESYVSNLLRIRKSAHPELWDLFRRHGEGIDWLVLAEVCALPQSEQVEAWAARTRSRPPRRKAVSLRQLKQRFGEVENKRGPYWRGFRDALALAIQKGR